MNNQEEAKPIGSPARRRFLAGVGVLSAVALVAAALRLRGRQKRNIIACLPEKKARMVKMLAEDGSLVEIDANLIKSGGKKVTDAELQRWIKR
ncbi:MAG TPA: hypothetical protein VMH27_03185 [Puia sp.]|nr:hypothetical protein [Puia sp.]